MNLTSLNTVRMDIVEISGKTVESVKILGMIPDNLTRDGEISQHGYFSIYVRWDGTVVRADRSSDDTMIVAASMRLGKVKSFHTLMQHLADHYGAPVIVAVDEGVWPGGQASKLTGTWHPATTQDEAAQDATVEAQVAQATQATTDEAVADTEAWFADVVKVSEATFAAEADRAATDPDACTVLDVPTPGEFDAMITEHDTAMSRWAEPLLGALDADSDLDASDIAEGNAQAWCEAGSPRDAAGQPVIPTPVTDADMRAQVTEALGADVVDFDVPWIVECLQRRFGTVDIDTINTEEFWHTLRVHGSRNLRKGSATVARIAPAGSTAAQDARQYLNAVGSRVPIPSVARDIILSYLSAHDLSADRYYMASAVRDLIGLGLPESEITGATIADVLLFAVRPWDSMESEIWAGTDTVIKRPLRTLLNRRKRKATKVNARRVRGGF